MGRWSNSKKSEADSLKKIEMSWLNKQGMLSSWYFGTINWTHGWSGTKTSIGITVSTTEKTVRLNYVQTESDGTKKDFDYTIHLTETPCRYGGTRFWFICPLVKSGVPCNRRVGVLYKDGDYFGCRHCYDLSYSSRNENRHSHLYPLFRSLALYKKIEDLEQKIKRPFYANKATRKQRQVMKMQWEIRSHAPSILDDSRV